MQPLKIGVAYHGNRLIANARHDLEDMVQHGMNLVVHMFSHNDWDRSSEVMRDIFAMTEYYGMEYWVDNWGLNGSPGDSSHYLSFHPDAHQVYSNGELRYKNVCYNYPDFVEWTKQWIDTVYDLGGRKIFWDEPHLPVKDGYWGCTCPYCKKLFEERFNKPMPVIADADAYAFQEWTISNYMDIVTTYAASKGMQNAVCIMPGKGKKIGISLDNIDAVGKLANMNDIGTDPYWVRSDPALSPHGADVYKYVYESTRKDLKVCEQYHKDHNIWIQSYACHAGDEEDVVTATDAAYDAGARTIIYWGYRGSEGNNYRAKKPDMIWQKVGEAAMRIRNRDRDLLRAQYRAELGIEAIKEKLGLK